MHNQISIEEILLEYDPEKMILKTLVFPVLFYFIVVVYNNYNRMIVIKYTNIECRQNILQLITVYLLSIDGLSCNNGKFIDLQQRVCSKQYC